MNKVKSALLITTALLCPVVSPLASGAAPGGKKKVEGFVHSARTQEPVAGASILVKGTSRSAMTDADGRFLIDNLDKDSYTLQIRCMSYKMLEAEYRLSGDVTRLSIGMEDEALKLEEVVVKGAARRSAEAGMVQSIKSMPQVASGMSGAQIARGPDRWSGINRIKVKKKRHPLHKSIIFAPNSPLKLNGLCKKLIGKNWLCNAG